MRVTKTQILCYLCYNSGEEKTATGKYISSTGEEIDVCKEHAEIVQKTGLHYIPISPEISEKIEETE